MPELTGRPAYRQVADDLRVRISSGAYPVGEALPSTAKLMEQYGVSITVVRAAVKELRNEGLTVGQPGKGVFVVRKPTPPEDAGGDAGFARRLDELTETVRCLDERVSRLETRRGSRRAV